MLHFSTHGVERDDAPLASFVALSPGAGGEDDDGRLTTADVYGLELNADLVFLSACRTARGGVSADGVMGLTRAFFHAGASSIVASLSDVVDEPAQRLVADFYRARLAGVDKVNALRKAQLAMLRRCAPGGSPREPLQAAPWRCPRAPALWAPFVPARRALTSGPPAARFGRRYTGIRPIVSSQYGVRRDHHSYRADRVLREGGIAQRGLPFGRHLRIARAARRRALELRPSMNSLRSKSPGQEAPGQQRVRRVRARAGAPRPRSPAGRRGPRAPRGMRRVSAWRLAFIEVTSVAPW